MFKLGELFSGPGGMALGAKFASESFKKKYKSNLSIEHIWGVDFDSAAITTYQTNLPGEGVCTNAKIFTNPSKESAKKQINNFRMINALAFGFPCNDFSMVGKQKGIKGDFGELYKAGVNAINYSNPLFFVAENVSGIHSANAGKAFKQIRKELEEAGEYGYTLTVHLYKFEEYGIPQTRHRYIIVGIRNDQKVQFKIPHPTHDRNNYVTAETALFNIPQNAFNNTLTSQSTNVINRLIFIPPWHNAWFLDTLLEMNAQERREYLKDNLPWYNKHIKNIADKELKNKIINYKLNCTRARMSHIYKRLDKKRPSYTITGSGGGGTHVYHWSEHRALTNRERARLQTFPDEFEFKGSKEQVRKQIGMAVPPEASKQIFEAILKTFAGIEYPSTKANYP